MSSRRALTVRQALDLIPDVEDLLAFRTGLLRTARHDPSRGWMDAEDYRLVDTKVIDSDELAEIASRIAEESRIRLVAVYQRIAEAIRREAASDHRGAANSLVEAGEIEEAAGRVLAAESLYRKASQTGRRGRVRSGESLALRRLARLYRSRGFLLEAESLYRESLDIALAEGDDEGVVVSSQGLGNVMGDLERWGEAGDWYARGLQSYTPKLPERLLWQLRVNLSVVARKQGDFPRSHRWLESARETVTASGDSIGWAYVLNSEGLLSKSEGRLDLAESSFRTALLTTVSGPERATLLVNLAECLADAGQPSEALSICRDLEDLVAIHGLDTFIPYVYRALGRIATVQGDENGFVFFERALSLAAGTDGSPLETALTQLEYARFEAALGRDEAARVRYQLAESLYRGVGAVLPADQIARELSAQPNQPDAESTDSFH